jgi:hypothetical protein
MVIRVGRNPADRLEVEFSRSQTPSGLAPASALAIFNAISAPYKLGSRTGARIVGLSKTIPESRALELDPAGDVTPDKGLEERLSDEIEAVQSP